MGSTTATADGDTEATSLSACGEEEVLNFGDSHMRVKVAGKTL